MRRQPFQLANLGWALNHDLCPSFNRYVYWLKHPLAVLGITGLAALAIGFLAAPQGYAVAGGIALVVLLGVLWPWLGLLGVSGRLSFERRRVREGETAGVVLRVRNRLPWPCWGLTVAGGLPPAEPALEDQSWGDLLRSSNPGQPGILALASIPGWTEAEFCWDMTPAAWGLYPRETPCIETDFPFGLWRRRIPLTVDQALLVWPRVTELVASPAHAVGSAILGPLSQQRAGHVGEVLGVRAFRHGDLTRNIHWAQSARLSRLIVCERQAPVSSAVRLVVDLESADQFTDEGERREVLAGLLRISASLTQLLLKRSTCLEVQLPGERLIGLVGAKGEQRVNDALAHWDFDPSRRPPRRSLSLANGPRSRGANHLLWVVTASLKATATLAEAGGCAILVQPPAAITPGAEPLSTRDGLPADLEIAAPAGPDLLLEFARLWERNCGELGQAG